MFPKTEEERINRTLLNMPGCGAWFGRYLDMASERQFHKAAFFSEDYEVMEYILAALRAAGYIEYKPMGSQLRVTPSGWNRIGDLRRGLESSKPWQVFVAMPFEDSLKPAFDEGIDKALKSLGYEALRVDVRPKTGDIPARILAEIRNSSFIIADFTLQNRGVYFEAGFAEGIEKPIIFTCRKDCFNLSSKKDTHRPHFDLRNRYFILWSDPQELYQVLVDRVGGFFGRAPQLKPNE